MSLPPFVKAHGEDFLLFVKVQPRASADKVGKLLGSELQIKLTAPPVDNAANEALLRFVARSLKCRRNQVELVRGHTSRHKEIRIQAVTIEQVVAGLQPEG